MNFCDYLRMNNLGTMTTNKFSRDLYSLGFTKKQRSDEGGKVYMILYTSSKDTVEHFMKVPKLLCHLGEVFKDIDELTTEEFINGEASDE